MVTSLRVYILHREALRKTRQPLTRGTQSPPSSHCKITHPPALSSPAFSFLFDNNRARQGCPTFPKLLSTKWTKYLRPSSFILSSSKLQPQIGTFLPDYTVSLSRKWLPLDIKHVHENTHTSGSALFWEITERTVVIPYRPCGTNYRSDLTGVQEIQMRVEISLLGFLDPLRSDR